jgi:hypothetical protein
VTDEKSMAELRAEAKGRGITIPRGATKDEVDALLSPEDPAAVPAEAPVRDDGQRVAIVRQNDRSWTCPVCGNATVQGTLIGGREACAKCGAERDGSEVIVHADR